MIGVSIDPALPTRFHTGSGPVNPPPDPNTGGGGSDPDPEPATLPLTPAARWHPAFSTITENAGRITGATDLMGLADVSASGTGLGPKIMTDALGRKFWRFEGYEYLNAANNLVLSSRDMAVFMVGRFHRVSNKCPVFSMGTVAGGNPANTLGAALEASVLSRSAPMVRGYSYPRNSTYPGAEWLVAGSQMQVVGVVGGSTVTNLWINDRHADTTKPYPVIDVAGAEIGRYAKTPGSAGNWGTFDLYEMIVFDRQLTTPEAGGLTADLMAHYNIPSLTNQLVLEGDSIMQGTDDVTTGLAANMVLTGPNTGLLPPDWRVVNVASSGNQVGDLRLRRDATSGWPLLKLPGQNVLAVEIGRNDFGSGGRSATSHYNNFVAYLNTSSTGVLNRGWTVRVMANIASGSSFTAKIEAYRALLRDPALLTDTGTGPTQPFAGQLSVVDTDLITDNGDLIFATTADATNTTYYVGDSTHLNVLGTALRMSGGDDPTKGVSYGL
jgi:hypothetical protein